MEKDPTHNDSGEQATDIHSTIQRDDEFMLPHPELDKRPTLAVIGLVIGILGWIGIFVMPGTKDGDFSSLYTQIIIEIGIGAAALILSYLGRKRAFGMSLMGMIVGGALMLFMIIPLLVMTATN